MVDFTIDRAIINEGRHLTEGTRDRYISHTTQGLLEKDKKHKTREAIWKNIQRNPKNPRYAVTEDFVWALFGRGADKTKPVNLSDSNDIKTFCTWLQHSESLRGWFSTTVNGEDWEPDRVEIKFSKEIDTDNFPTAIEAAISFAKKHEFELMEYAPQVFADQVNAVFEEGGEDFHPDEKEAAILAKSLSSKTVHPFVNLDRNALDCLLNYDGHSPHLEIFIATNSEWLTILSDEDWVNEQSHKYITSAVELEETLEELDRTVEIVGEDTDEVQAYFLALNHWDNISPEAQLGRFRSWLHSWFGLFRSAYQAAEQMLTDQNIVLAVRLEYQEIHGKSPDISFNAFLLEKIEENHLAALTTDQKGLGYVVKGIADAETLARFDQLGECVGSSFDDDRSFDSRAGTQNDDASAKKTDKDSGNPTTENIGKSKKKVTYSSSTGGSTNDSPRTNSDQVLRTPRYGVGESPFSKILTDDRATNRELSRVYAQKSGMRKLAFDANSSWVETEKVKEKSDESSEGSGLAGDTEETTKYFKTRLIQLFLQGQTTQFLELLFSDKKEERDSAKANMIKSINAANMGAKTIESPLVLVLREGSKTDEAKALCKKNISRLNKLLKDDTIFGDIANHKQLFNLLNLSLPEKDNEKSSLDPFFLKGDPKRLFVLLESHHQELREKILEDQSQLNAARIIKEKIKNLDFFKDNDMANIELLLLIDALTYQAGGAHKAAKSPLFQTVIERGDLENDITNWIEKDTSCKLIESILRIDAELGVLEIDHITALEDLEISDQLKAKLYLRRMEYTQYEELYNLDPVYDVLNVKDEEFVRLIRVFSGDTRYLTTLLSTKEYRDKLEKSRPRMYALGKLLEDSKIRKALSKCSDDILKWLVQFRAHLNTEDDTVGQVLAETVDGEAETFIEQYAVCIRLMKDEDIHDAMLIQSVICDNFIELFKNGEISPDDMAAIIKLRNEKHIESGSEAERALQKLMSACHEKSPLVRLIIGLAKDSADVMQYLPTLSDNISKYLNALDDNGAQELDADDVATLLKLEDNSIIESLLTKETLTSKVVDVVTPLDRVQLSAAQYHVLFNLLASQRAQHLVKEGAVNGLALKIKCREMLLADVDTHGQRIYALWNVAFVPNDEDAEESNAEVIKGYAGLFNQMVSHHLWRLVQDFERFHAKDNYQLPNSFKELVQEVIREHFDDLSNMIFAFLQPQWLIEVCKTLEPKNTFVFLSKLTSVRYKRFFDGEGNEANVEFLQDLANENEEEFAKWRESFKETNKSCEVIDQLFPEVIERTSSMEM